MLSIAESKRRASARNAARHQRRLAGAGTKVQFIYTLSDASGVRYVGHCAALAARFVSHTCPRGNASSEMRAWVAGLAPGRPGLWVIQVVDSEDAAVVLERRAIALHLDRGCSLINIRDRKGLVPSAPQGARCLDVAPPGHWSMLRHDHGSVVSLEKWLRQAWRESFRAS
jgi:hypothetical protein